jgi:DNA-directed RNA polymerase specialized sigma24 family protein
VLRTDPLRNPEPLIRRVYSYAAYRVGDGPDAEDVTSETFERALRYTASYDPRKGEPIAWLLGIARRCADQHLANRLPVRAETPDVAAPGDLEAEAIRQAEVRAAVAHLSDRERELIAKLPYDEAAWLRTAESRATYGETGFSTLERVWARPTCEVHGVWGGYTGPGHKTIVPT